VHPSAPTNVDSPACPGSDYVWSLPYILASYPLSIHTQKSRHDPGYSLLAIDIVKSVLRVRSTYCRRFSSYNGTGCSSCCRLESSIAVVRKWATQPFGKKPASRLSHDQMETKLVSVRKQLKNEQLKVNNLAEYFKSLKRARKSVESHKYFYDLISTNNVPGLARLLSNSRTDGWGISKTTEKVELAINGKYHARNYTDLDVDLAVLIYELGGGAALHALNHSPVMLPSRYSIADVRREHRLRITVGSRFHV
ncbi:hypothetical protein B0H14DRAFT_2375538, partial [Mycena olivaceomarginata]